jgi:hypothetical protein
MHYWIDIFSTDTLEPFLDAGARTSGYSENHANMVKRIPPGDVLLCYVKKVKKWVGALRIIGPSADQRPIWGEGKYPFRLQVEPLIMVDLDHAVPLSQLEGQVYFFQSRKDIGTYKGFLRSGLTRFNNDDDAKLILRLLKQASKGQRATDWTEDEVRLIVDDYFAMLQAEADGEPYDKTEHRRLLKARLNGRSDGSIEFKHQNISAVLADLGRSYIAGYKPRHNYQGLLADAVERYLGIPTPSQLPVMPAGSWKDAETLPPTPTRGQAGRTNGERLLKRDLEERDANNRILGGKGEELVMLWERERLRDSGCAGLADKVRRISLEDDSAGYDIQSFGETGETLFIEVKTTAGSDSRPFYVSRNELETSQKHGQSYWLYRVYDCGGNKSPRYYRLSGPLDDVCEMRTETYSAVPRNPTKKKP